MLQNNLRAGHIKEIKSLLVAAVGIPMLLLQVFESSLVYMYPNNVYGLCSYAHPEFVSCKTSEHEHLFF